MTTTATTTAAVAVDARGVERDQGRPVGAGLGAAQTATGKLNRATQRGEKVRERGG